MNTQIDGVLVQRTIKGLIARSKRNASVTEETHRLTGASEDAGEYRSALFPREHCGENNAYERLIKARSEADKFYYAYSLPWEQPRRLCTAKGLGLFDEGMRPLLDAVSNRYVVFLSEYETLKGLAKAARNSEWRDADYPPVEKLANGFCCELLPHAPIAQSAHFQGLVGPAIERAKQEMDARNQRKLQEAMANVWQQVMAPLNNMVARLSDPDAVFHDTLVENIRDIANRIPLLNVTGNGGLGEAKQQLEQLVAGLTPEALRANKSLRLQTAWAASSLVAALGQRKFAA